MYLNLTVKIPEQLSGIPKKNKRATYICYEHGIKCYSDKQYTVPQCTSIGKVCEEDSLMVILNGIILRKGPTKAM